MVIKIVSILILTIHTLTTHALTIPEFKKLALPQKIASLSQLTPADKVTLTNESLTQLKNNKKSLEGYFDSITFDSNDLSQAQLEGCIFNKVTFNKVNATKAQFANSVMIGGALTSSNFSEVSWENGTIVGESLDNPVPINQCDFSNAALSKSKLNITARGSNFSSISAPGVTIKKSIFDASTSLQNANLQFMEMTDTEVKGNLTQADMRFAFILESNFFGATLTQAQLADATLLYTSLADTQADGMNLQGTNFMYSVSLAGANLAKSVTSPTTNYQGAFFCRTLMPAKVNDKIFVNDNHCGKVMRFSWNKDVEVVEYNKSILMSTKQCPQCFLEEADLRGLDLSGANLSGAWMRKANLSGTNLSNAQLQNARLPEAIINGQTKFTGALLCNTLMPQSLYPAGQQWRMDSCQQVTALQQQAATQPTAPKGPATPVKEAAAENKQRLITTKACPQCDLSYANLADYKADNVDLSGAKLLGTHLSGAKMNKANFSNAQLMEADLTNTYFPHANFTGANLANANATAGGNSDWTFCNLTGATLDEATFTGLNLSYSNLTQASAYKTNFTNAKLTNANLQKIQAQEANFTGAQLQNAALQGALFVQRANLTNANLKDAQIDATTNFSGAIFCHTIMPDGTERNDNCQ